MSGDDGHGMDVVVRTSARWLKGFVLAYGVYVVVHGHLTPGGGFAGGVIIASAFILHVLACGGGATERLFSRGAAASLESAAILAFLGLACLAMARADGAFLENFITTGEDARFHLVSAGTIPIANVALGLKVASSLFLVFSVVAAFRVVSRGDEEESDEP